MNVMNKWRRLCSVALPSLLGMTLWAGCAATPLSRFPDFPKTKPTLGTLAVLADVTSLVYKSGDIQKLDLVESERFGTVLLNEMASALNQKGYVVGKSVHATVGWTLRPGTLVYAIRSVEDRDRDPLPLAELPMYVSQELAGDPALKQAWETLRSSSVPDADASAALSRLGQAFGADTIVIVVLASLRVPLGTQVGRAMLQGLTFGATSVPATSGARVMIFADTRSGRVLWQDMATGQSPALSERVVKNTVQALVRPLP
jgi:hypothetical protein